MRGTKRSEIISTQLRQIAAQAIEHPERVFTTLIHRVDVDFLREAYYRLRQDGAPGLSGMTAKDYGKELEANLSDLHERLKAQRYVVPPIKRVWIDKEGGKQRPIGLLEIEDKIVQKAVSMLMGAVYEQDFYPFSYGFREAQVQALWTWCRNNRHMDLAGQHRILCSKLRGHFQYFGVRCNMRAMEAVRHHAERAWKYWLHRRSSKKAMSWEKFEALRSRMPLPTPKIIHSM